MGFVTLDLVSASGKPGAHFQLSDSALTISRLRNLIAIAGRIPLSSANCLRVTYVDDEGDAITCSSDDDVKELFSVASSNPAKMLKVSCLIMPSPMPTPPAPRSAWRAGVPDAHLAPAAAAGGADVVSSSDEGAPDSWSSTLTFYINGEEVSIDNPDPSMHLVDYIRDVHMLKATKIGCYEGGCGACSVVISWSDPSTGETMYEAINSCLRPLCSMAGLHVITAEGIGSEKKGYHPIQTALADANGSQCGFCSVGWTMRAYSMLEEDSKPEDWKVDNSFDGNLCRCTGMFPILKAFKTFSPASEEGEAEAKSKCDGKKDDSSCCGTCSGCSRKGAPSAGGAAGGSGGASAGCGGGAIADVEDLVPRRGGCCSSGSRSSTKCCSSGTPGADLASVPTRVPLPDALRHYVPSPLQFKSDTVQWFAPTTLAGLTSLQKQFASAPASTVKFVSGNTAYGVEKYFNGSFPATPTPYSIFIDVSNVPELTAVSSSSTGLTVGASVSLGDLIILCNKQDPKSPLFTNDPAMKGTKTASSSFAMLANHLLHVANRQVRAVASWAGNLMLATHHHDFPSDVVLCLMGLGATMSILQEGTMTQNVPIEQVYEFSTTNVPSTIIVDMTIPYLVGVTGTTPGSYILDSYKIMLRHQNTHALTNACFVLNTSGSAITDARVVYGAVTCKVARMTATEEALIGNSLDQATLDAAQKALTEDIARIGPSAMFGTTDAYRRQCAASLLYKLFVCAAPSSSVAPTITSAGEHYIRPVSTESSTYDSDPTEYPLSKPVQKLGGLKQSAGEVEYTFDVKLERDALCGAICMTTVPAGTLVAIDTSVAETMPGVVQIITAKDITGKNDIGLFGGPERALLEIGDDVACVGQPVAVVLADTFQHALAGSHAIKQSVSAPATKPIFTIEDAIAAKSFWTAGVPDPLNVGDPKTAISGAAHSLSGTLQMGAQRHFYMEVQNAVARIVDGDELEMTSSMQFPFGVQHSASTVTGLPMNKVHVKCRRAGGGFGGKLTRNLPVAAAASISALTTGRQVHVQNERAMDTQMSGARESMRVDYEVGFDDDGLIAGIIFTIYINAGGYSGGYSSIIGAAMQAIDNCYNLPAFSCTGVVCKTNIPAIASMRAPGVTQGVYAMEAIMTNIARALGKDAADIRAANFLRLNDVTPFGQKIEYLSLPTVWSQLSDAVGYSSAKMAADAFNSSNRFRKRGVCMLPARYGIAWTGYNTGATVRVYPGDFTVEITTSGCEIGQGMYTKVAQAAAHVLGVDMSLINVIPTNSDATPAAAFTGGSATSELCCQSVTNACNTIVERLAPFKKANPSATWQELCYAATGALVSLSATGWYSPLPVAGKAFNYFVYSAMFSQVEIDVLTGEVQIQKSHMVYDCGQSLNPLIDVGQVEGAFVMGLGHFLTEDIIVDQTTGRLLTPATWDLKPPFPLDIPEVMQVDLLKDMPNPVGVYKSKAVGEPSYALAASLHQAVKYAVQSARDDAGVKTPFDLPVPATPCAIATACMTTPEMLVLSP